MFDGIWPLITLYCLLMAVAFGVHATGHDPTALALFNTRVLLFASIYFVLTWKIAATSTASVSAVRGDWYIVLSCPEWLPPWLRRLDEEQVCGNLSGAGKVSAAWFQRLLYRARRIVTAVCASWLYTHGRSAQGWIIIRSLNCLCNFTIFESGDLFCYQWHAV